MPKHDYSKMYIREEVKPNFFMTSFKHKNDVWILYDDFIKKFEVEQDEELNERIPKSAIMTNEKLLDKFKIKYADVPKMEGITRKTKFINIFVIKDIIDELNKENQKKMEQTDVNEASEDDKPTKSMIVKTDTNTDNVIKMFKYHDKDVTMLNVDGEFWFKAKEVAEILGYGNAKQAIQYNLKPTTKKSYQQLITMINSNQDLGGLKFNPTPGMDKKTVFINEQGLYKLVFKSNKPEAEAFTDWVADILITIRKHGSYSVQPVEKLEFKSFCEDNLISTYDGKHVLYIGYTGVRDNEHIFKYGISRRIFQRTVEEHTKTFGTFQLLYVKETDNKEFVEDAFGKELMLRNLYRKIKINNSIQTELFTITIKYNIDSIVNILDTLISQCPSTVSKESNDLITSYESEIKRLKSENAEMATNITFYKDLIKSQQNTILTLAIRKN